MAHLADRILSAVLSQLAAVPGIQTTTILPLHLLEEDQLPALIITDIEDQVSDQIGHGPVDQWHALKFAVQICHMAAAQDFMTASGAVHASVTSALFGSREAITLSGLITQGLREEGAAFYTDSESIQQPVGGWKISVTCYYTIRSDFPGKTEKE